MERELYIFLKTNFSVESELERTDISL